MIWRGCRCSVATGTIDAADSLWLIILRFYHGFAASTVLPDRRFGGGSWDKQS